MATDPLPDDAPEFPRPRPAKAALKPGTALPDYLPARMLNEFVYCPRLFYYEWVDGVFAHSSDTLEGAFRHEKVDARSDPLPEDPTGAESIHSRSVQLSSERLHIIAKIDLVEGDQGAVRPVDYKKGSPRDTDDGPQAWPADRVQVAAQGLILRDNGYACSDAVVYYYGTKQRVHVAIDDATVTETEAAIERARQTAVARRIPPPLVDSPKCPKCSLVNICLPDETALAMSLGGESDEQLALFPLEQPEERPLDSATASRGEVRRLVPARDDLRPLYVTGHGLSIGKSSELLEVRDGREVLQRVRMNEVSQVNVFGNVQVTGGAVQALCWAEKPVSYFSTGSWFYGITQGLGLRNVFLRREQFRRADDAAFCLTIARDLVATKIRNQRTLLQRNHVEPPMRAIEQLKRLVKLAVSASEIDVLLGIEGTAARTYFEHFAGMIKVEDEAARPAFDFQSRNRRPPRDPINALLSLAYSLLVRDLTIVCHQIGFDPFIGFYHQPRFGRPSLALDLMEGFRPLVADSAVLFAVNTGMVGPKDFIRAGGAVGLSPSGRRGFIRSYEQRMDMLVTHPVFGYRVSYRRVLEIQARLLARVVTGELARYAGFETR